MKEVTYWDLGRKARPPKPTHPQPGQLWSISQRRGGWRQRMLVLTMEVGAPDEHGRRDVQCLVIESESSVHKAGSTVTLTNGSFNPPNEWIK